MDNSNKPNTKQNEPLYPLGMSSSGQNECVQFGQNLRHAMACVEALSESIKGKAIPDDEVSIRQQLKTLSQEMIAQLDNIVNKPDNTDRKMSQRRADAAVLMAETSLQSAGKAIATADRCQVFVSLV